MRGTVARPAKPPGASKAGSAKRPGDDSAEERAEPNRAAEKGGRARSTRRCSGGCRKTSVGDEPQVPAETRTAAPAMREPRRKWAGRVRPRAASTRLTPTRRGSSGLESRPSSRGHRHRSGRGRRRSHEVVGDHGENREAAGASMRPPRRRLEGGFRSGSRPSRHGGRASSSPAPVPQPWAGRGVAATAKVCIGLWTRLGWRRPAFGGWYCVAKRQRPAQDRRPFSGRVGVESRPEPAAEKPVGPGGCFRPGPPGGGAAWPSQTKDRPDT